MGDLRSWGVNVRSGIISHHHCELLPCAAARTTCRYASSHSLLYRFWKFCRICHRRGCGHGTPVAAHDTAGLGSGQTSPGRQCCPVLTNYPQRPGPACLVSSSSDDRSTASAPSRCWLTGVLRLPSGPMAVCRRDGPPIARHRGRFSAVCWTRRCGTERSVDNRAQLTWSLKSRTWPSLIVLKGLRQALAGLGGLKTAWPVFGPCNVASTRCASSRSEPQPREPAGSLDRKSAGKAETKQS